MPISKTDALHELIQSLTKSEKRYFKLRNSQINSSDDSNNDLIFDFLEKQKVYDEKTLKEHFKGAPFLNRLAIAKKRLYEALLSSLDQFHTQNSTESILFKKLHSFDILYRKGLYEQGKKLLNSIKKSAKKENLNSILIEVNLRQKKLIETNGYLDLNESDLDSLLQEDINYTEEITLFNSLWNQKARLFLGLKLFSSTRNDNETNLVKDIELNTKKLIQNKLLTFETKYLSNHILSACTFALNNFEQSLELLKLNLNLFNNHSDKQKEYLNAHISTLANAIHITEKIGNKNEVNAMLFELKQLSANYLFTSEEDVKVKIFNCLGSAELNLSLKNGIGTEILEVVHRIQLNLEEFGSKISFSRRMYFNYQIALAYLFNHKYKSANQRIVMVLQEENANKQEDIFAFSSLIELLISHELGKINFVLYEVNNVKRALKKKNRIYQFENIFLNMIHGLASAKNSFDQEETLMQSLVRFEEIRNAESEKNAFEYFDVFRWINAKLDFIQKKVAYPN